MFRVKLNITLDKNIDCTIYFVISNMITVIQTSKSDNEHLLQL